MAVLNLLAGLLTLESWSMLGRFSLLGLFLACTAVMSTSSSGHVKQKSGIKPSRWEWTLHNSFGSITRVCCIGICGSSWSCDEPDGLASFLKLFNLADHACSELSRSSILLEFEPLRDALRLGQPTPAGLDVLQDATSHAAIKQLKHVCCLPSLVAAVEGVMHHLY